MNDVQDNPTKQRYEITVDGALAGFSQYVRRGDRLVFTHTEIDPAFEGQGLGGALVKTALADVRRRELRVVPLCPFVARYIERHQEEDDLVDHRLLAAFGDA